METKVLLTNVNSVWGVIVNPQSSNTYRHAISFKDEQMKRDYVSQELFGGTDFTTLFAKQPEIDFTIITGSKAEFIINTQDYPNETMLSLLNKDFCILKIGDKYYYYTLFGERQGSSIKYTAELDIFFTYDIKEMFNNKESRITRAMTDRFYKDGDLIKPVTDNKLLQFNSPLYNEEDIKVTEDNLIVSSPRYNLLQDLEDKTTIIENGPENFKRYIDMNKIREMYSVIKFQLLSSSLNGTKIPFVKDNGNHAISFAQIVKNTEFTQRSLGTYINMNYATVSTPLTKRIQTEYAINENDPDKHRWQYTLDIIGRDENDNISILNRFRNNILERAEILKTSNTISPLIPLDDMEIVIEVIPAGIPPLVTVDIQIDIRFSNTVTSIYPPEDDGDGEESMILHTYIKNEYTKMSIKNDELKPIPENFYNFTPDINRIVKNKHTHELKSYFAPYRKFNINSSTKNNTPLIPQFFTNNKFEFESKYRYLIENWGILTQIKNYKNSNVSTEYIDIENNEFIEDYASYTLPTTIDAYEEFMVSNQSQQNGQFLSKGVGLAAGIVGVGAAAFTGGASLGLLAGGVGLAAKSATGINQQLAQRRDISNTPDKQVNNGSTLITDYNTKDMTTAVTEYKLPTIDDLLIKEHFYKYGYNFNSKLKNINEVLDTRYWFNHVEIPESFENIKLQASAEIKQLINDTLASGLTIWHCRDLTTFKGIKNYDYENVEMSLYNPVTKALNDYNKGIK